MSAAFFLKKNNVVGEKANSTVDFKTISFVCEIVARKLDFSPVGIESLLLNLIFMFFTLIFGENFFIY